jgi:predicted nucleic acid-binding protein
VRDLILDSGVFSLQFSEDPRLDPYIEKLEGGSAKSYTTLINLTEFYYWTCRTFGKDVADLRLQTILASDLEIVGDAELARNAGLEKCRRIFDLSTADCYILSLARRERGILLTTDGELAKVRDVEVRHFPI